MKRLLMFTRMARAVAKQATCNRLKVGAILVKGDHPISVGYNGRPKGEPDCNCQVSGTTSQRCQDSIHAEVNALIFCDQPKLGATMICTHAPCYDCAGKMINAGIGAVYYLDPYGNQDGITRLEKRGIEVVWISPSLLGELS